MDLPILFEDTDILVINKPSGVVVNRAQTVKDETVQDWVESYLSFRRTSESALDNRDLHKPMGDSKTEMSTIDDFYNRGGIVHRIDKETSGILLLAKTPTAFFELQRQFKERLVKKTYLAIAHGRVVPEVGEIRAPVGRLPWQRERFGVVPGGKEAVTNYKVQNKELQKNNEPLSVVELYPETGRTHQIRIHLKYINHPIVGDYLYAGRKTSRDDRVWAPRVMLHAWKITILHPLSHQSLDFEAPIPDDMRSIIHGTS